METIFLSPPLKKSILLSIFFLLNDYYLSIDLTEVIKTFLPVPCKNLRLFQHKFPFFYFLTEVSLCNEFNACSGFTLQLKPSADGMILPVKEAIAFGKKS